MWNPRLAVLIVAALITPAAVSPAAEPTWSPGPAQPAKPPAFRPDLRCEVLVSFDNAGQYLVTPGQSIEVGRSGQEFWVRIKVTNAGNGAAPPTTTSTYLNGTHRSSSGQTPTIAPGGAWAYPPFSINSTGTASFDIRSWADPSNQIPETSEINNFCFFNLKTWKRAVEVTG